MKVTDSDRIQLWKAVQKFFKISEKAYKQLGDPTDALLNAVVETLLVCVMAIWPKAVPYEALEEVMLKCVLPELARSREK